MPYAEEALGLNRYLDGVVIVDGEGTIDLNDTDPVFVGIVHDGSGFTPAAAIFVDQNRHHASHDSAIQGAFEIMEAKALEDEEIVAEHQEEWGDRWQEILTESFDGKAFQVTPEDAVRLIDRDGKAAEFIDIEED